MNERQIQNHLWLWRRRDHRYIAPNAFMVWGEADLISVTKAGFVHEYEIKISRKDFYADRKKFAKHLSFENVGSYQDRTPNYFAYVMPVNLVALHDIPSYAGLYYIDDGGGITVVREPPRLHNRRVADELIMKLCSKLMYRYWDGRTRDI